MTQTTIGDLTAEVEARLEQTPDPRLRQIMQAAVRHLHAFAEEVQLTDEEWMAGILFATEIGRWCTDRRQEWILFSDTMGLSSVVDLINHSNPGGTEPTILGPFYVPDSPKREFGESMKEYEDGGEPAVLHGRVLTSDGRPIAGAELDIWQNAATGFYAVQQPDVQPSHNLRGRYVTNENGEFLVRTVRPVPYPIPNDGPVGQLLRRTGRHEWRAAHIHLKVSAPGFAPVNTHVFDEGSDYLDSDTVFGVKGSLIRPFVLNADGVRVCEMDFVLIPA